MKKFTVLLLIATLIFTTYSFDGVFKLNVDAEGDLKLGNTRDDVSSGYSIISEMPLPISFKGFKIGVGVEYQLPRSADYGGKLNFLNTYLTFEKDVIKTSFNTLTPILKLGSGRASSSGVMVDLEDGFYYGAGIRYRLSSLAYAEVTYNVNRSKYYDGGGTRQTAEYRKINFTWGTKLSQLKNMHDVATGKATPEI
ncbi:MAG: hypothetical protein ACQESP_12285 [Candidatus Muiribacteriota bacterium]